MRSLTMCGPYRPLVSTWVTPSSTARRRTASAAPRSAGGPRKRGPESFMPPKPTRCTVRSPRVTCSEPAAVVVMPGKPRGAVPPVNGSGAAPGAAVTGGAAAARRAARVGSDEPELGARVHRLRAAGHRELAHHVADVELRRRRRDVELPADRLVGQPARQQGEHLALAR